jgi:uncharacterized membrane protein YjdF
MKMRRALAGPAIFAALYMVGASALALRAFNMEFIFYGLVMLLLMGTVWWVDTRVRLSTLTLWCLSIWGLAHMMGGTVPIPAELTEPGEQSVLYSLRLRPWLPKYDQVVHAFGFFTCTMASWRAMNAIVCGALGRSVDEDCLRPTFGPLFGAMMMGMGLSAMNEIVEFVATLIFENTNVGGYVNTGWDLVSNFTGCVIGALAIRSGWARRPRAGQA